MVAWITGILLAMAIGAACRRFEIPVPAPPKPMGALLIAAMTLGYLVTGWLL